MMRGSTWLRSCPSVGLYPQHRSQLQEPGAAEDAEQTNWPTRDQRRFAVWRFTVEKTVVDVSQGTFHSRVSKHFSRRLSVLAFKKKEEKNASKSDAELRASFFSSVV